MTEEQKDSLRIYIDAVVNEWGFEGDDKELAQCIIEFIESGYDLSQWEIPE